MSADSNEPRGRMKVALEPQRATRSGVNSESIDRGTPATKQGGALTTDAEEAIQSALKSLKATEIEMLKATSEAQAVMKAHRAKVDALESISARATHTAADRLESSEGHKEQSGSTIRAPVYTETFEREWNETDSISGIHMMPADHNQQGAPHSWSDCMKFRCSRAARCYMHTHQPSSSTSGLQAIRTALHESRMPCCADLLVLQLVELSSFLNSHSVPHAIVWGALLGALRSEDTIPWTADGDVAVPAWGIHRLIDKPWNEQLAQRGYLIMGEKQADAMGRMCINRYHPELEDLHDPFLDNGHQNGYINSFVYVDIYAAAKVETSPPVMLLTPFKLKMSHQQYSCHEVGECLVSRVSLLNRTKCNSPILIVVHVIDNHVC